MARNNINNNEQNIMKGNDFRSKLKRGNKISELESRAPRPEEEVQ